MTGRAEVDCKIKMAIEKRLNNYPDYLKGYYFSKNLSIRTMDTYLKIIEKFINHVGFDMANVTMDDINKYIYEMSDCTNSHKATTYSALKSFFNYLYKTNKIQSNPMEYVERVRIPKSTEERNDYLNEAELQRFLYNLKNGCGFGKGLTYQKKLRGRDTAICYIFLHTGMRLSALAELNIGDLDFEKNSIKILTKGSKIKLYDGLNDCFKYIREWMVERDKYIKNDTDALFVSSAGERLGTQAIENIIKKYTKNISGKNITPHKLRATYATMLYRQGVDLDTLCELMGHSSVETTRIYIRGRENKTSEAAKIMSRLCK